MAEVGGEAFLRESGRVRVRRLDVEAKLRLNPFSEVGEDHAAERIARPGERYQSAVANLEFGVPVAPAISPNDGAVLPSHLLKRGANLRNRHA
jgi:hypothetical protein